MTQSEKTDVLLDELNYIIKNELQEDKSSTVVVGVRLQPKVIDQLKKLAQRESLNKKTNVTYNDLIRDAISRTYHIQFNNISFSERELEEYKELFHEIDFHYLGHDKQYDHESKKFNDIVKSITNYIEKNSIARQFLYLDKLPNLASPRYDMGGSLYLWKNNNKTEFIEEEEILLNTYEIATYSNIRLSDLKSQNMKSVMENNFKNIAIEIIYKEELAFFSLLQSIADNQIKYLLDDIELYAKSNDTILVPDRPEFISFFESQFKDKSSLSSKRKDLSKAKIIVVKSSLLNNVVLISRDDKSEIGVICEKQPIIVLPADDPMTLKVGWVVYEEIGMAMTGQKVKFLTL